MSKSSLWPIEFMNNRNHPRRFSTAVTILCAIALNCVAGHGQEVAKNGAPPPPSVRRVPPHTQWTITLSSKVRSTGTQSSGTHLESIIGYKAEEDVQLTSVWSDGTKTEDYVVNGFMFTAINPLYPNDIHIFNPSEKSIATPGYDRMDFPEMAWVDARFFVNTATEDGHECYVYKRTVEQMIPPRDDSRLTPEQKKAQDAALAKIPPQTAWIDTKTGLPVKYDNGSTVMTYAYSSGVSQVIAPAKAYETLIMAYVHRMPR